MKRIISIVLALALLALAGCTPATGQDDDPVPQTQEPTQDPTQEPTQEPTPEAVERVMLKCECSDEGWFELYEASREDADAGILTLDVLDDDNPRTYNYTGIHTPEYG
ncbi:MAG: hypothetical protein Q4B99_00440, partial [Clostridia bacterium]|nr:hypothetical protein [Clostridia bacterium]